MRRAAAVVLLLAAGCGSGRGTKPATPAATPAGEQLASLQTSMTELLERLDVMNDRITRLERAGEERAAVRVSAPVRVEPPPARASEPTATAKRPARTPLSSAQTADEYKEAIVLFGKNHYPEARAAFQRIFEADSSGELADNALFWIGETYYAEADYNSAIRFYRRVGEEYGDQNKAPDAMYKLALAYEKTSDLALARTTLQELIARYPYSAPAASAKSELNRIRY